MKYTINFSKDEIEQILSEKALEQLSIETKHKLGSTVEFDTYEKHVFIHGATVKLEPLPSPEKDCE